MAAFPLRSSCALVVVLLAGLAAGMGATSGIAKDVTVIRMTDAFRFEPDAVTIHAGDAVEWRNVSPFDHVVTDDRKLGDAAIPAGAQAFSSGAIAPGRGYRRVFTVPGDYRYFCVPHEGIGMVGRITVLPR